MRFTAKKVSKIGWADFSGGILNVVSGCTAVSEGCQNCYARGIYNRFDMDFTPTFHPDRLDSLKDAQFPEYSPKRGKPHKPMAFLSDCGDMFHPDIQQRNIWAILDVISERTDVSWIMLTKRPARMDRTITAWRYHYKTVYRQEPAIAHFWVGATVESQQYLNRLRYVLRTPAGIKFASAEPMLAPVSIWNDYVRCPVCGGSGDGVFVYQCPNCIGRGVVPRLDWVICGAESGPNRRDFDKDWADALMTECLAGHIPFFAKQDSGLHPGKPLLLNVGDERPVVWQKWPYEPMKGNVR